MEGASSEQRNRVQTEGRGRAVVALLLSRVFGSNWESRRMIALDSHVPRCCVHCCGSVW